MYCDIMYIQQNTPQITIHMLYIDTLQYFNYFKSHIHHPVYVCCDQLSLVGLYIYILISTWISSYKAELKSALSCSDFNLL